jgi:predicted  nucleic acid-binding Zn-ribbon protein
MSEIKDTKDFTVEEKLKALYDLQLVVSEIDKIKTLRGELPLEVQDLEDEIAGLSTRAENLETEINEAATAISNKRLDIETAKGLIEKYTADQDNVKNNREYESLTKEIEYQGLEIELCEKKIREFSAKQREKEDELNVTRQRIEDRKMDLDHKKTELDQIIAETKQEEEALRDKAKALEEVIEPRLLSAFKRIRQNARNGLSVVYVQRDACGGCFNKIPPQRQVDVRLRKKIIVCEYCGRILIDPELAEASGKK